MTKCCLCFKKPATRIGYWMGGLIDLCRDLATGQGCEPPRYNEKREQTIFERASELARDRQRQLRAGRRASAHADAG